MSTSSRLIIWAISSPNKQRWFRLNCKTWKLTEKKENSSRRVTDVLSRLNYIEFLRYSTTPYFGDWHNKSILFSLYGRVKQFWFLSQNQMFFNTLLFFCSCLQKIFLSSRCFAVDFRLRFKNLLYLALYMECKHQMLPEKIQADNFFRTPR